jgi:hypothetical protein
MPPEIVIERLIATVEKLDLVRLFETADENCHSASHRPKEGFRRMGGFSRGEIGKALQLARCPGNLYTREREFGGNAFESRQHEFLPLARFSFAENAMTALSFPYSPAEQRQGVGKKIRVAVKLQLLF